MISVCRVLHCTVYILARAYISGEFIVQTTATIQVRAATRFPPFRHFIHFQSLPSSTFAFLFSLSFFVFAPPSPLPFHLRVAFAFSSRLLLFFHALVLVVGLLLGLVWMARHLILVMALCSWKVVLPRRSLKGH